MAIPKFLMSNFNALVSAIDRDKLCLVESRDRDNNNKPVALVCVLNYTGPGEDAEVEITPVAVMLEESPFARFVAPSEELGPAWVDEYEYNTDEELTDAAQ